MSTDKLTLQRILQLGYAAYEHSYPLPDYICRAVWALLTCRTAVFGRHVQARPHGHAEPARAPYGRAGAIVPRHWPL